MPILDFESTLSAYRRRRKIGQAQLAKLTGVSPSFISKLERGSKAPSQEFLSRLKRALELSEQESLDLAQAAFYSRRRIILGRHLDRECVEIINLFIERVSCLQRAPLRALLESIPPTITGRSDM